MTTDASLRHASYELMRTLVFALEIPLAVTALTSGIVLAVRTKWGVFQHYWIISKLSLLLATALIGIVAIRPWTEQMLAATQPQAANHLPAARWLLAAALAVAITALATVTGLSVYKPRGRTRRGAAAPLRQHVFGDGEACTDATRRRPLPLLRLSQQIRDY